nr:MAG TPA: hypothetical protein [Caudoviricetes sp.]
MSCRGVCRGVSEISGDCISPESGYSESNRGLAVYKTGALPTELYPNLRIVRIKFFKYFSIPLLILAVYIISITIWELIGTLFSCL